MTAIDRAALIEVLRDELAGWPVGSGYYGTQVGTDEAREMAHAALPVIARELLAPLRELHADHECGNYDQASWCHAPYEDGRCVKVGTCSHCGHKAPCPTVRLLDQIESDAKGDE